MFGGDVHITEVVGFEWDSGNVTKSEEKHGVHFLESEQVFFNQPLLVSVDNEHSNNESRFFALGKTDKARYLFVVFTIRKKLIWVISARDMSKKERRIYEKEK
ncbi:hypothetical protein CO180_04315 [candidate division WWE3 bacterium CG_4_9_14_3_um_filter_41_6]|uniref:BrnT family toxin n=1 Tax=candidate division WWE3 bacterium CG_4_10_14_0_2_um_filter_41_14 TaxID=1975072 RepID=A0A2M7TLZ7_UNCKA|nr:MAG: hypothetical protein COY32_00470 [candidate division WWE3 bacterium CG_4_10_14_0_2_um_filter_41_14]PJA38084.1 MAG: hypothetical protein CO180_04315 [candidate division WWE3 bacterium CG_4_9_14_3_um_filter_41_6]